MNFCFETPTFTIPPFSWVVIATITAGFYYIYNKVKPFDLPLGLPGPKRLPFLGILKYFDEHFNDWPMESYRLSEKYKCTWGGPVPNIGVLSGGFIMLVDEKNVKHVLRDNFKNYEKGKKSLIMMEEMFGNSIFNADGDAWQMHRKIMSQMFSRNLVRQASVATLSSLVEISSIFQEDIKSNSKATLDIQDLFRRMTFDLTIHTSFGVRINSIRESNEFILKFDEFNNCLQGRMKDPLFQIKRYFNLTKTERKIKKLKQTLDKFIYEIINSRRRSAEDDCELGADILSRFIDHSKKHGAPMGNEQLRDIAISTILAGRDTTASSLSWTFYELTHHPEVVHRIVEEVSSICGPPGPHADYSFENISKLQYTHAVATESLRLHAPLPVNCVFAKDDDVLPDGTFVPAKIAIMFLPFAMGRSSSIWGEDALDFKPERFLNEKEPSFFKYLTFNAGPRTCLGKPLVLMTLKMAMAYLLPRFEFNDNAGHSGACDWTLVTSMKGGFEVDVTAKKGVSED